MKLVAGRRFVLRGYVVMGLLDRSGALPEAVKVGWGGVRGAAGYGARVGHLPPWVRRPISAGWGSTG